MKKFVFISIILVFTINLSGQNTWTFTKEKNAIKVYTRPVAGSKLKECRTLTTINAPINKVFRIIRNVEDAAAWIDKVIYTKELKSGKNYYISYEVIHLGHGIKDRDLVTLNTIEHLGGGAIKIIITSASSAYPEQKDKIRIKKIHGYWLLQPLGKSKTKVTYQFFSDPQNIPAWIINTFISESPYKTMLNLRRLAQRQ